MELHLLLVVLYAGQYRPVGDGHALEEGSEVVSVEVSVRAAMCLSRARGVFGQDALAAEGAEATAAAVAVSPDVAIGVADVVAVFFVEGVVCEVPEARAPEDQGLLEREAYALHEERVL